MRIHSSRKAVAGWPVPANAESKPTGADRIGERLVAAGALTPAHVEQILRTQAAGGGRFGEAAVALGFVDQATVDAVLAGQFDFAVAPAASTRLDPALVAARGGRDHGSELIRSLRVRLAAELSDVAQPLLMVASLTGKVGRRVIASNLAIAFAQAGTATLLIDADLRVPALDRLFGVVGSPGLSTLLASRDARAGIVQITEIPGLAFLPGGPPPPNPVELLSRLPALLPALRAASRAELVILNTPPIDGCDDALGLGPAAPQVLIVARRDYTRADHLAAAARRLDAAGCTIIGSVLNVA